jgi:putative permease
MHIFKDWFKRHFTDPEIIILTALLVLSTVVMVTMGQTLAPILASVFIAYLLDGLVAPIERLRVPRFPAVLLIFLLFMAFLFFVLFGLLPMLSFQMGQFVRDLPNMFTRGKDLLMHLPSRYPELISQSQISALFDILQSEIGTMGQKILTLSMASVRGLVTFLVYMVLMPLMVFFFLKDKQKIFDWLSDFLPENKSMSGIVWQEVNLQFGNYVRGKFWEVLIIWLVSYVTFLLLGLKVAMLIGLLVGLSVLVPYIGATVVVFPVALVGFFQWGVSSEFMYLMIAYGVIQLIDGNVLAPLLLSEVVNLHPIAIVTAVLVFGGLWGFWGVFFAIPLATLVQAVLRAWTHRSQELSGPTTPEYTPSLNDEDE